MLFACKDVTRRIITGYETCPMLKQSINLANIVQQETQDFQMKVMLASSFCDAVLCPVNLFRQAKLLTRNNVTQHG